MKPLTIDSVYAIIALYFTAGLLTKTYFDYKKDHNLMPLMDRLLLKFSMLMIWAGLPFITYYKILGGK